jgi:hypothetical protein
VTTPQKSQTPTHHTHISRPLPVPLLLLQLFTLSNLSLSLSLSFYKYKGKREEIWGERRVGARHGDWLKIYVTKFLGDNSWPRIIVLPRTSCIQHHLHLHHRYHLRTDNTHRPRRCASSYPSLSAADTPYPTMAWRWLWRSLERMTESHRQQEDRTGFPDSRSKTNTNTLKLSDLPPELIILIARMLSTQSAACLSLCNRAMSQIVGPNIWRCLKIQNPGIRASFLSDLSKDLPQHFVCYRCVQLHASSAVQWPQTIPKALTRCLGEEPAFVHCSQSASLLRFPHI